MPKSGGESTGDPRSLFESHLAEIERIVGWIARRSCLSGDDAEEFGSWVNLKLMEEDFRILRRHSGRSNLETYLVVVIQNLARDYRTSLWGRWRPSAAAERRGVVAVELETLMYRDGFSLDEATEMLRRHHGARESAVEIADIAGELTPRARPLLEGGEAVAEVSAPERSDAALMRSQAEIDMSEARRALNDSLAELDREDRLILLMHYESGLTLAAISRALDIKQRRLYTRRDASLRALEAGLERRGLDPERTLEALRWSEDAGGGVDFQLSRPSNLGEGEGTGVE